MKKIIFSLSTLISFAPASFPQTNFSDEVKTFIDYNAPVTVLKNCLLIDGKGNEAKPKQTIIIKKGIIDWVGDDASASTPTGSQVIDVNGRAVLPGWVMLHEHLYMSTPSTTLFFIKEMPVSFPRLYLACGATTIRTAGSIEPYLDLRIKKEIDSGKVAGPALDVTGPYLQGKESQFYEMHELKSPDDAVKFVNYWAEQGCTSFKAYMNIDKPTLKAAVDAVHKRGLKITGHLCAVTYREAAELGIDQLEHGFRASTDFASDKKENSCPSSALSSLAKINPESDSVKELIRFLVSKKVIITSTLSVSEGSTTTQPMPDSAALEAMSPDARNNYFKILLGIKSRKAPTNSDKAFLNNAKMEKQFYDAGGLLTVGTDPTGNGGILAGYHSWRAIELLVEADGFTPLEAIKIATLNGAMALRMDKIIGTIDMGKRADLIVIDGDPSKKITDIRKVVWVFKSGVGFNSKKLFDSVRGKVGFY